MAPGMAEVERKRFVEAALSAELVVVVVVEVPLNLAVVVAVEVVELVVVVVLKRDCW